MFEIVLMSHGDMAEGVKSSLEMLAGKQPHVHVVSLQEGGDDLQFEKDLKAIVDPLTNDVLLIADLLGGTPCNVALKNYADKKNIHILSGLSLPLALEATLNPDSSPDQLVLAARKNINNVKKQLDDVSFQKISSQEEDPSLYAQYAGKANIVNTRIDERLVHGQVAGIWSSSLGTQRIIVANDSAANDPLQKSALRMATPPAMRLSVLPVKTAAENIQKGKYGTQKIFLLFKNPEDVATYLENGGVLKNLTVGNMSFKDGSKDVTKNINVLPQDIKAFESISNKGVKIIAQMVPDDSPLDFMKKLKEI